jgi:hypothetical protein
MEPMLAAPPPNLPLDRVKRTAIAAVRPYFEPAVAQPSPPHVVDVRFAPAGGRRVWIVRVAARWYVFRCPLPPPGEAANGCVAAPAGTIVVHIRDRDGRAYSVVPVGG